MVNDITSDTMLIVYLKEAFTNEFEENENVLEETQINNTEEEEENNNNEIILTPYIDGADFGYPFDTLTYSIKNADNGI